jgi:hypothetical protein
LGQPLDPLLPSNPPPETFGRRRFLAALGAGTAVGAAVIAGTQQLWAAVAGPIDAPATATAKAVRIEPPRPRGGFDPSNLYVALYGHPGSRVLGVLGEQPPEAAADRAQQVAAQYAGFGRPVVPTFELITTVASSEAGADGDYSNEFPDSKFVPWIDVAAARGMHVLCDLQPGRSTFPSQAREIESLLAYRHVSLALDPEWRVGPTERPGGGRIGTVDAAEVNETIAYLDALITRLNLPPKMLVVHQFTPSMVTDKAAIRGTRNVVVVFQMDGFGTLELKLASWNRMIADLPAGALTAWKNFYDEDRPTPTPAQTMAVTPRPVYVSYQ